MIFEGTKKSIFFGLGLTRAGRRKPPEYIPRLKKYQIMYEQQFGKQNKKEHDDTV